MDNCNLMNGFNSLLNSYFSDIEKQHQLEVDGLKARLYLAHKNQKALEALLYSKMSKPEIILASEELLKDILSENEIRDIESNRSKENNSEELSAITIWK